MLEKKCVSTLAPYNIRLHYSDTVHLIPSQQNKNNRPSRFFAVTVVRAVISSLLLKNIFAFRGLLDDFTFLDVTKATSIEVA